MNSNRIFIRTPTAFCLLALIVLTACHPSPRSLTVVTGKVVYGTLAMEGAVLKVFRQEDGWELVEESFSGYHGSFRLHLAEGTYRIEAGTTIRSGGATLRLSGVLDGLTVNRKKGRMDQVVVELGKE